MRKLRIVGAAVAALVGTAALGLAAAAWTTGAEIDALHDRVVRAGAGAASPRWPGTDRIEALPAPVRRWVAYTFPSPPAAVSHVEIAMAGRFRRPGATAFHDTTARQTIAAGTPALAFDASTSVIPGIGARAFDAFVDGRMTMKARVLSAFTVVDEHSTPALDRTSLRRWLIEASFVPVALLPGGPLRWEPIDDRRALAIARLAGVEARMVATFADDGRLVRFDAQEDGDLSLPYHGSGERVERSDERLVHGMRIPHGFVYSRVAAGRADPFWEGRLTRVRVASQQAR